MPASSTSEVACLLKSSLQMSEVPTDSLWSAHSVPYMSNCCITGWCCGIWLFQTSEVHMKPSAAVALLQNCVSIDAYVTGNTRVVHARLTCAHESTLGGYFFWNKRDGIITVDCFATRYPKWDASTVTNCSKWWFLVIMSSAVKVNNLS